MKHQSWTDVAFWLKMKIVENCQNLTSNWHWFDVGLTLDFGNFTTQPKNNKISTSVGVNIGRQINIDIRCGTEIEFWSELNWTEI